MKLTAVLAVTLGMVLLFSTMPNLSYADDSVKVYAKEKQGMMLILVKNAKNINVHQLTITLLDGTIDSARSNGWMVFKDSTNQVTLTSPYGIPAKSREVFFVNTNDLNSIISWAVMDRTGFIVAMDNARAVLKQNLNNLAASDNKVINAKGVTITTDKIFYNKGEKMFISGFLEPNSKITITIYTPNGQELKIGEQTNQNGNFAALHVLHNALSGTYTVKASEPKAFAETTFKVI